MKLFWNKLTIFAIQKKNNYGWYKSIKIVLVEKKKTNKWLADQIGKDQATVSKWCTNTTQPTLETLVEIARILEVDIRELLVPTDYQKIMMTILQ